MTEQTVAHSDQDAEESAGPGALDQAASAETPDLPRQRHRSFSAILGSLRAMSATRLLLLANALVVIIVVAVAAFCLPGQRGRASSGRTDSAAGAASEAKGQEASARLEDTATVSWKKAHLAFARKDYAGALDQYRLVFGQAQRHFKADWLLDFLRFRMGQCLMRLGQAGDARKQLLAAAEGECPAVRAPANYQLALLDERDRRYLAARMRAYQAAGVADTFGEGSQLATDCDFLVAKMLTMKVLSFYGSDELVPWSRAEHADPFAGIGEAFLPEMLAENAKVLRRALLGPKLRRAEVPAPMVRWAITCWAAPLEDLLARYATQAKTNLRWSGVDGPVRQRQVTLYFRQASHQRACEIAAGSAGLVARFTGDEVIVYDPLNCESMDQQRALLVSEAISAWRRFFLRAPGDRRIGEGLFAVAALHQFSGEVMAAINEYQLVAKRFGKSRVAPRALLASARARIELRDYTGAKGDLTRLLDGYPYCEELNDAYAALGEATMKAGLLPEAIGVLKKLYFLNLSASARRFACFNVGKCLYQKGDHEEAVTWLNRYVGMIAETGKEDLAEAYLLLGDSYAALRDETNAVTAFGYALAAGPDAEERVRASLGLAHAYSRLGNFAKAIASLKGIEGQTSRSAAQDCSILIATAQIYRAMGLPEKGAGILRAALRAVSDSQLSAALRIELARCYRAAEQPLAAHKVLTELLPALAPGPAANEAACELAEVSLEIDRPEQTIAVAGEVINSSGRSDQRLRAQKLLYAAHLARREYDEALQAFSSEPTVRLTGQEQ